MRFKKWTILCKLLGCFRSSYIWDRRNR